MGEIICINKRCKFYDEDAAWENCSSDGINDGRNRCKDAIVEYILTEDDFMTCPNCGNPIYRHMGDWESTVKCSNCYWKWKMMVLTVTDKQLNGHLNK